MHVQGSIVGRSIQVVLVSTQITYQVTRHLCLTNFIKALMSATLRLAKSHHPIHVILSFLQFNYLCLLIIKKKKLSMFVCFMCMFNFRLNLIILFVMLYVNIVVALLITCLICLCAAYGKCQYA